MSHQRRLRVFHIITTYMLVFSLLSSPVYSRQGANAAPEERKLQQASATVSLTKSDSLLVDQDGDGMVGAGDTIRYTLVAKNTGSVDASGVTLNDVLDGNLTLSPGSLRSTPLAYSASLDVPEDSQPVPFTLLAADFDGDALSYTITANPQHGVLAGTAPDLTYQPSLPDYFGTDSLTFQACDAAAPANCDSAVVTINVLPVNDAPAFTAGAAPRVLEDSGAFSAANWASAISKGPANESGQVLNFIVNNDNLGLFSVQPAVAANGTLTFTPAPNAYGQAVLSVALHDDGGTANGGSDTSAVQTVLVTVDPVNDAPSFAVGPDVTVLEDAGLQTLPGWATSISAGPNESGQTLTFEVIANTNPGLFAAGPSVSSDGTLSFQSSLNLAGTATITLRLRDNGGTASGGVNLSGTQTFKITVEERNDAPVVAPASFAVPENSPAGTLVGAVTYTDPDAGQTHVFAITGGNTSDAFGIDPASGIITVSNSGALNFETNPVFHLTVTVTDNGIPAASGSAAVDITLTDTNDAPVVTPATFSLPENSLAGAPVGTVNVTDPDSGQTHTFTITAGNTGSAFAINNLGQITVLTPSVLDYETRPTFTLTVQATDDGSPALSASGTITVNLTDVNEAPTVDSATFSIPEYSVNGTTVGTVAHNDQDGGQAHTYAITAGNTDGAFAIDPATGVISVANAAALKYKINPTFSLTVTVTDNGSPVLSGSATITVNLSNVNDAPVVAGATFDVPENSANGTPVGTVTYTDEDAGQTHTFSITSGNTSGAFTIDPATGEITVSGPLDHEGLPTYTLVVTVADNGTPPAQGSASITVNVTDVNEPPTVGPDTMQVDENSLPGASVGALTVVDPETSQTHTFVILSGSTDGAFAIDSNGQITVANSAPLNYEVTPSFPLLIQVTDSGLPATVVTLTVTVNLNDVNEAPGIEDTAFTIDENLANGQMVGTLPVSEPDGGQTHTFEILSGNTGTAFAVNGSGQITVANTTALNFEVNPSFTLTVRVTDSGTPALNDTAQVIVTLNDLNEAPIIQGESYQAVGNTVLQVAAASSAPAPVIFVSGNLLANDSDPDAGNTLHAEFNAASAGAVVTVTPSGEFTYLPPAGVTSDSFTYRVVDQSGASTVATVTIELLSPVWYVKNDAPAGGLGRSTDPFDTLAEAEAASTPGDTIYIYYGDGTTTGLDTGITLKSSQRLIGAGVALNVPVSVNGGLNPTSLLPADQKSAVVNANPGGTAVVIENGSAEVRGLSIASWAKGIDAAFTGAGDGTVVIQDNTITAATTGFDLLVSGGSAYLDFSRNAVTASTNGISANQTGGALTITGFADNQVDGSVNVNAAYVNGAVFDSVPGGALDPLNLGAFRAGMLGTPVGGSGLTITNAQGDLRFTSLDLTTSGANALLASGTGAGLKLSIADGQGRILANNGAALNLTSLDFNAPNLALTSANSATDGVKLTSVTGSLTITGGSVINSSNGTAFLMSGGSATVLYNGSINQSVGRTVEISGWHGSSAAFSGPIIGGGTGVLLQENSGGTTSFVGGLMLNTGTNNAFTAINAGTLVVTGSTNSLTTTSGTALSVSDTTIGSAGLTFNSISANGAPVGIELLNTGSQGGTTITGAGMEGSGGIIQNTSDDAVRLIGTQNVSLNYLNINNAATSVTGPVCNAENATNCTAGVDMYYVSNVTLNGVNLAGSGQMGVSGYMVNGLSITNSSLLNAGNSVDEYALLLHNPSGTLLIQDSNLAGMFGSGIRLYKYDSPVLNLILRRATLSNNNPMAGEDGLEFKLINAKANMLVEDSIFTQLAGDDIDGLYQGSTQLNLTAQNNTFQNSIWNGGVSLYGSDTAGGFLTLNANTFNSNRGTAVLLTSTQFAELNAKVINNTIATSSTGEGIHLSQEENSTMTVLLNGNQVSGMSQRDISATTRLAAGSGSLHIQATGNTAEAPLSLSSSYAMDFSLMDTGHTVCLNLDQNTATGNNAPGIRVHNQAGIFQLEGASGTLTADAAAALINSRNTSTTAAIASLGLGRTFTGVASGTCRTAVGATQLPMAAKSSIETARPAARVHGLARLVSPFVRAAGETLSVNIGTLPAGKSVTLTFDVLVADPLPAEIFQVSNQAVLHGSNFADVLSDDPATSQAGDPTVTNLYSSPIAEDDQITLNEDTPVTVPAPGVLANDLASSGYTLHVGSNTAPASGTLNLAADGGLAYTPAPDANGDLSFTYVANDGRKDSNTAVVTLHVLPVNDAPRLDPSGAMRLNPVGATSIFGSGTLISELLNSDGDRISDVDAGAVEGIAVVAADTTHGLWQYTTNGGLSWQDLGQPTTTAARLLASDADTRLRFISYSDYFGTVNPAIIFRAWDRTSGTNGAAADVSVNGGSTAFSTAVATASIQVYEVADLSLSKTASESEILAGNTITYTLEVTNEGPSAAHNVSITDPLPAGINLVSVGAGCTETGGLVTCTQASLNMGESASYTITIDVPQDFLGALVNTATAASDTTDLNTGNNTDSATVNVIGQVVVVDPGDPIDPADWSDPIIQQPECGSAFMGEFNNETVTLALDALPQHTDVTLEFDLIIIRSWDGNQVSNTNLSESVRRQLEMMGAPAIGPDVWGMSVDGKNIITTTFSNWDAFGFRQAYPGTYPGSSYPARTGAVSTNSMCYTYQGYSQDTVYHMRYTIPHSDPSLKIDFSAQGLQSIDDESWGLNNVMVSVSYGIDLSPYKFYLPIVNR